MLGSTKKMKQVEWQGGVQVKIEKGKYKNLQP